MSTQTTSESGASGLDTVKLVLALVCLITGIVAYHYFVDYSVVYRTLGVVGAGIVAVALVSATAKGRALLGFFRESRIEVRKVVWPTRQEAAQATLMVVALVFFVGIFLWLLDMLLFWAITSITG
ncbi:MULTISPECIES: preprotein translocase subunit SecE [Methylococcus]|jgi:preprotein translocase subunit SecE|uniref:Protein translocase subunit SecE n=2 Tax=Methylococcus capsulatus TaxID=414 RepID=Q60A12_METCA|nr:preprotein translocase subunit SecE [Methylococcus capsulatus]AAU92682.1 preprotein translocase, SecE subunit [Methylococcus capsulatus str. Bath]QXP88201.1 preprotein translocase subunit SecE [Methylococcus capsulatus]QXP90440.1 preprotein translocase subunit SecE [Methylococcus capsulatus]QXP94789.1 preprotein translocase subunit SecE [Methylococcus capsulatus]UQN13237.1 preprotein translocase subunit SecE [Methylococcus capsulatus]